MSLSNAAVSQITGDQNKLISANFSFSMLSVPPLPEFLRLGAVLSPWRRSKAEKGRIHQTARKLGALFEQIAKPPTELVKAYGLRVSEISGSEANNPKGSREHGPFKEQVGADATAIWAAATSGNAAMSVLLLACMLARVFEPAQATAIWAELVEKRKLQIGRTCDSDEILHIVTRLASQQEISREELEEWDASARAWITVADKVKKPEHQRMKDVLEGFSVPVDESTDVFESIIPVWKTAMETMGNLINGMPQVIYKAPILVAISAWHLYPDVCAIGCGNSAVVQGDSLIQSGGCVTIGLEDIHPDSGGVYWSLSLANLRYYGDPIPIIRHIKDASKVSFDEMKIVVLGSVFASWEGENFDPFFESDCQDAARFITVMWKALESISPENVTSTADHANWLKLLASAANAILTADNEERATFRRLLSVGIRRGASFLAPKGGIIPAFFGFSDPNTLVDVLKDDEKVVALRRIASRMNLSSLYAKVKIRYYDASTARMEYATVDPAPQGVKRDHDGNEKPMECHTRWIEIEERSDCCTCHDQCLSDCPCLEAETLCSHRCVGRDNHRCENTRKSILESTGEICEEINRGDVHFLPDQRRFKWYNPVKQEKLHLDDTINGSFLDWEQQIQDYDRYHRVETYEHILGDIYTAAVFATRGDDQIEDHETQNETAVETVSTRCYILEMIDFLDAKFLEPEKFLQHWVEWCQARNHGLEQPPGSLKSGCEIHPHELPLNDFVISMKAISAAAQIYSGMQGADVALQVLERKLWASAWPPVPCTSPTHWVLRTIDRMSSEFSSISDQWEIDHTSSAFSWIPDTWQIDHASSKTTCCCEPWKLSNPSAAIPWIFDPWKIYLPHALACVAMFETGNLDVPPQELSNVFAMSTGNSIYVAETLLSDPHKRPENYELRRIIGNVGRAGLSMLIPPADPRVVKPDYSRYHVINHDAFSGGGQCSDHFDKTSLHLSFTKYKQPVPSTVHHGAQDSGAWYLETLISVYDGGDWIGDLDVLRAMNSKALEWFPGTPKCEHAERDKNDGARFRWISIVSWHELIEQPQNKTSIVQAHGNSFARLAAAVVCIQKGVDVCFILPSEVCHVCVRELISTSQLGNVTLALIC